MYLHILLPIAVASEFLYKSDSVNVCIGCLVRVDFKGREAVGIVTAISDQISVHYEVKEIKSLLPIKPFSKLYVDFLLWLARYNMVKAGLILRSALVADMQQYRVYRFEKIPSGRLTSAEKKIINSFAVGQLVSLSSLKLMKVQKKSVVKMLSDGTLTEADSSDFFELQDGIGQSNSNDVTSTSQLLPAEKHQVQCKLHNKVVSNASSNAALREDRDGSDVLDLVDSKSVGSEIVSNTCVHSTIADIAHLGCDIEPIKLALYFKGNGIVMSDEQNAAFRKLHLDSFCVNLLDGVTGSGKTIVYIAAVLRLMRQKDLQAMIILPEIALSTYLLKRIKSYFNEEVKIVEWHSRVSKSERAMNWDAIVNSNAKVIVGARSAIFLPVPNLGIIIVDEEHDQSFKQDQGEFTYNARDTAIMRGKMFDIPVILASATPALETIYNVQNKHFVHVKLEHKFGGAIQSKLELVDMRKSPRVTQHISAVLVERIKENIASGMQALLFLNRRGYASFILCSSCGYRIKCPNCISWLVEHQRNNKLLCHLCGFEQAQLDKCTQCSASSLVKFGPGVEKIAEEIKEIVPEARVEIVSSDVQLPGVIEKIEKNEVDIVVGTQIVSKGYDFPKLTLLAVVDADATINGGDLRSTEKSFQVIQQAIGRVGRRKENPGKVVLQSYSPDSFLVESLMKNDRDLFYQEELLMRKKDDMPPFTRLISIIISGFDKREVVEYAGMVGNAIKFLQSCQIFGPAPALLTFVRNRFRYRILIIAPKNMGVQKYITQSLSSIPTNPKVKLNIDVDPFYFA